MTFDKKMVSLVRNILISLSVFWMQVLDLVLSVEFLSINFKAEIEKMEN